MLRLCDLDYKHGRLVPGKSLLVDTCVWLAECDDQDDWHGAVSDLFDKHILVENGPLLFYTEYIQGEFLNRVSKDCDGRDGSNGKDIAQLWWDRWTVRAPGAFRALAQVLPPVKDLEDLKRALWHELDLGETDAGIVAHACYYNMPLLTVDSNTIVNKLQRNLEWFRTNDVNLTVLFKRKTLALDPPIPVSK